MRSDPFSATQRLLREPSEVTRFVQMLDSDTAHALYTVLRKRIDESNEVHDHPRRPHCWSCGVGRNEVHNVTCMALVATALALVNVDEDRWDIQRRGWSYRERYGGMLEEARRAGAPVSVLRPDPDALQRWTQRDHPGEEIATTRPRR